MRYVIVVVVVKYIFPNFNQYIFTKFNYKNNGEERRSGVKRTGISQKDPQLGITNKETKALENVSWKRARIASLN